MRMILLAAAASAALLGACKSDDVDMREVRGEKPSGETKPGFAAVGQERWRVQSIDSAGTLKLERIDVDDEIQRVAGGRLGSMITLSAEEIRQHGGIGIKDATLKSGDEITIFRTEDGEISTIELETTRDAERNRD